MLANARECSKNTKMCIIIMIVLVVLQKQCIMKLMPKRKKFIACQWHSLRIHSLGSCSFFISNFTTFYFLTILNSIIVESTY